MNRLRRLFHRHRWTTLTVTLAGGLSNATITTRACWCGERRTTTDQGE
ncbi:hypothetical protein [Nonomuraea roseoviolacea]|uniref:Uncharacterized protein n=1 Tax=Nonomuraea roseoviolacea subsp. carminata TaxID=160689 RepID=A0ABT1K9E7_9ACTN|nr:hypothetical protein [Nonomuraea roseoviolacea]MCP2350643.1 hypothetical protein [Nonomuraea roseoviolacea subsp. carminata]